MKERPIIFGDSMVRALLAGTKSQTRRVVKPPILGCLNAGLGANHDLCPYGQPGDRLWVREAHMDLGACFLYRADANAEQERAIVAPGQRWKPAIHMPRVACRITLEVTGVRVERLHQISRGDAMAEGCPFPNMQDGESPVRWYEYLWRAINGPDSWDANPWVWVIEFKRLTP